MIAVILLSIVVIIGIIYFMFPLIQVCGDSMYPTYSDEEVIIGRRLYLKSNLKVGDVIVYQSPEDENRKVIKRIADIQKDFNEYSFYCLGDNPPHSYDSRDYGYVSSSNLVCKIVKPRPKKES